MTAVPRLALGDQPPDTLPEGKNLTGPRRRGDCIADLDRKRPKRFHQTVQACPRTALESDDFTDPEVGHRLERRPKCLRSPGNLLRPRRPEPAEGGRVRVPCGNTDVLLSLPNRYRFRFHSIEPPRLCKRGALHGRSRPPNPWLGPTQPTRLAIAFRVDPGSFDRHPTPVMYTVGSEGQAPTRAFASIALPLLLT